MRQITVGDVQADASRIMTPVSAKGRGRKQRSEIAVPVGADVIARLKPLLAGRAGHEPLLQHWVGVKGFGHMTGPVRREAWRAANQMQKGWRTALAAAGLPYIEPYGCAIQASCAGSVQACRCASSRRCTTPAAR